ncbi:hypothetical protein ACEPAH_8562 [Sanghuangporus vaninii]
MTIDVHNVLYIALAGLAIYTIKSLFLSRNNPAPLPPGPKGRVFIGNLGDLPRPKEQEWIHWYKHKDLYGPISSITTFGQTLIILNDQRIAFDLLEKRSSKYSSRPRMIFGGEMVGWGKTLVAQQYSDRFRAYRKNIHAILGSKAAVSQFNQLQNVEVRRFLLRTLEDPDKLLQHIRTTAGAIILKISHGYTIEPRGRDPLVDLADEVLDHFSRSAVAGAWLVDTIPFLKYLPCCLPGMSFKRIAASWNKALTRLVEQPHAFVKQRMTGGVHTPSYTSALLEKGNLGPEEEDIVKWSAQSLYSGGADTTVSALQCFFLAMLVYPEVQARAQEEIDRVVGNERLPGYGDREKLPYMNAIVKEVLRWHPVGPLAFPHLATEDGIYEGYFIPKGALLIPNIWWFTHDPKHHHDPMTFKPERFLGIDGRAPEMDPHNLTFGFGRRVCPGRELADATIFLAIAQTLAVFNITKPLGDDGQVIEPSVQFTPGAISHPTEFRLSVTPRSEKAAALIRSIEEEHPFMTSDAKALFSLKF